MKMSEWGKREKITYSVILAVIVILTIILSYAKQKDIFSHSDHLKMEMECDLCHSEITTSEKASDSNLPSIEICKDCHDGFEEMHDFKSAERELVFSHETHTGIDIVCNFCHLERDSFEVRMPEMDECLSCHDSTLAPNECTSCHSNLLGGKLKPKSHDGTFLHLHGSQALVDEEYCANCHRSSFCLDCHRGENVLPPVHDRNYSFSHSIDARSREYECSDCHELESFCIDCHREKMVLPISHASVAWSNRDDGGQHRIEARINIESCIVCHDTDDPICSDCHF